MRVHPIHIHPIRPRRAHPARRDTLRPRHGCKPRRLVDGAEYPDRCLAVQVEHHAREERDGEAADGGRERASEVGLGGAVSIVYSRAARPEGDGDRGGRGVWTRYARQPSAKFSLGE